MFAAFTEECLAAPFTDQIFHFVIPALADTQAAFPFEPFLDALLSAESGARARGHAPWLFYFVLTIGENYLGMKCSSVYPRACVGSAGWWARRVAQGAVAAAVGTPWKVHVPRAALHSVGGSAGTARTAGSTLVRHTGYQDRWCQVSWGSGCLRGSSLCAKLVMF